MRQCVLAIFLILSPTIIFATTIHVPADQPTIQAGIDAAIYGDTVQISPGLYNEHSIVLKSGIVILGNPTAQETIVIDGQNLETVFTGEGLGPASAIVGITVIGGDPWCLYIESSSLVIESCVLSPSIGGAAYFYQSELSLAYTDILWGGVAWDQAIGVDAISSSFICNECTVIGFTLEGFKSRYSEYVSLYNCTITGNKKTGVTVSGGALYFEGCLFEMNESGPHGMVYDRGGAISAEGDSIQVIGCVFNSNTANDENNHSDFKGEGGAIYIGSCEDCVISNCTFADNVAYPDNVYMGSDVPSEGGAIWVSGSSVRVESCIFEGNGASSGSGIFCQHAYSLSITDCGFNDNMPAISPYGHGGAIFSKSADLIVNDSYFTGNAATYRNGGGIYWEDEYYYGNGPAIQGCMFTQNSASRGGALYGNTQATVLSTLFDGNWAISGDSEGGGASLGIGTGVVSYEDCVFNNNSAATNGGALYYSSPLVLKECEFGSNSATGGSGGAVYCNSGSIEYSSFYENLASGNAGAINIIDGSIIGNLIWRNEAADDGGGLLVSGECFVSATTFYSNTAERGSGVFIMPDASVDIGSTIISYGNVGEGLFCYGSGIPGLACVDIFANAGGDWISWVADQFAVEGNIALDPLFSDPENGDFSLLPGSPCLPENNMDCDDGIGAETPVFLSSFNVQGKEGKAEVSWSSSSQDMLYEFTLFCQGEGSEWDVPHTEVSPGYYTAVDDRRDLAFGGIFLYTLSGRDEDGSWEILCSQSIEFNPYLTRPALLDAYPNPFNPHIAIPYRLLDGERCRLTIYDISGRLVRVILDNESSDGSGEAFWNGSDSYGNTVASGIYFVHMEAAGFQDSKRIVLLR